MAQEYEYEYEMTKHGQLNLRCFGEDGSQELLSLAPGGETSRLYEWFKERENEGEHDKVHAAIARRFGHCQVKFDADKALSMLFHAFDEEPITIEEYVDSARPVVVFKPQDGMAEALLSLVGITDEDDLDEAWEERLEDYACNVREEVQVEYEHYGSRFCIPEGINEHVKAILRIFRSPEDIEEREVAADCIILRSRSRMAGLAVWLKALFDSAKEGR